MKRFKGKLPKVDRAEHVGWAICNDDQSLWLLDNDPWPYGPVFATAISHALVLAVSDELTIEHVDRFRKSANDAERWEQSHPDGEDADVVLAHSWKLVPIGFASIVEPPKFVVPNATQLRI